ncbi:MAG: hypothetical protein VB120_00375 [Lachnospiraceae bacterium]|nr:hypothetical protein [Lachnospiraceae bacterium]
MIIIALSMAEIRCKIKGNIRKKYNVAVQLTNAELKVLYAYYKGGGMYSEKKNYGVSTTDELKEIIEKLKTISAIEYSSYNFTKDRS